MNCPKCGNEVNKKTKFCAKCGFNMEQYYSEQLKEKKEQRGKKIYKVKKIIALILFLVLIITISILIYINVNGKKSHKSSNDYQVVQQEPKDEEDEEENLKQGIVELEFKVTDENKDLDYDKDGLTNEEEEKYGTKMIDSDSDGDGLTDYDEVKKYNSDPAKYSTSGDDISDYIKVQRKLEIDKTYKASQVKPEDVKVNGNITLKPDTIESQYYGGLEEYETDKKLNSTYRVFDLLDFVGIVEYNTNNSDSILLVKNGSKYYEFPNYENDGGKLTITITEDDNYTDFVITTKENFENYKKGE